jgi:hypothetical protein
MDLSIDKLFLSKYNNFRPRPIRMARYIDTGKSRTILGIESLRQCDRVDVDMTG